MTRTLDRLRSGRLGVLGFVLLLLLILVIAHVLIMGVGHDAEAACGGCVVVIVTALAAFVVGIAARSSAPLVLPLSAAPLPGPISSDGGMHPPPIRTTVLRL